MEAIKNQDAIDAKTGMKEAKNIAKELKETVKIGNLSKQDKAEIANEVEGLIDELS